MKYLCGLPIKGWNIATLTAKSQFGISQNRTNYQRNCGPIYAACSDLDNSPAAANKVHSAYGKCKDAFGPQIQIVCGGHNNIEGPESMGN
jgi:hypothetical protein